MRIYTGIGREVAKKLVELGANTVALSRTQSDLDSLKSEVSSKLSYLKINTFRIHANCHA